MKLCYLTLVISVLAYSVSARSVPVTYGVKEEGASIYKQNQFTCIDGSNILSSSQLNDDYCDCADGSDEPGTSACNNGHFFCKNTGHFEKQLMSSRVNDGICDCCDGSDEYNEFVSCINTCQLDHDGWVVANSERLVTFSKGTERLHDWISEGENHFNNLEQTKSQLQSQIDTLSSRINTMKSDLDSIKEQHDSSPEVLIADENDENEESKVLYQSREDRIQDLYVKLGLTGLTHDQLRYLLIKTIVDVDESLYSAVQRHRENLLEISDHASVDEDLCTDQLRDVLNTSTLYAEDETLRTKNNEIAEVEKEKEQMETELNGLINSPFYGGKYEFFVMRNQCYVHQFNKYVYEACPFGKAKQDSTSLGSEFSVVDSDGKVIDDPLRNLHVNENNQIEGGDVFFYWKNGQQCWSGPQRSLKLRLMCGEKVELRNLVEPSMCVYEGEFLTPAVCPL